jgi:hypothetical protein
MAWRPAHNMISISIRAMGAPIATINQTLSTGLSGSYINDFLENGRIKGVYAQADAPYRMLPTDLCPMVWAQFIWRYGTLVILRIRRMDIWRTKFNTV